MGTFSTTQQQQQILAFAYIPKYDLAFQALADMADPEEWDFSNSPNPDLALVAHKIDNTTYTARTCLSLKMAYNNARLIVKPQSSWLKP